MAKAETVFVGTRISSITVLGHNRFGTQPLQRYVFSVERVLKGTVASSHIVVETEGGNCDFLFVDPARYLVFLEPPDFTDHAHASICLNTRKLTSVEVPRQWLYLLEPVYRPLWGSLVFLGFSVVRPPYLEFDPHAWQLRIAWTLLGVTALLLTAAAVPRVRRRAGPRVMAAAVVAAAAALAFSYWYLHDSTWFAHLVH